jgi:hypothetical protein
MQSVSVPLCSLCYKLLYTTTALSFSSLNTPALAVLSHPAGAQAARDRAEKLQQEIEASMPPEQVLAARVQAQAISFEAAARIALRG